MSGTEAKPAARAVLRFEGATPILRVKDLRASLAYYVNVLGFKVDFEGPGIFAGLSRDRCSVYLCQGNQGHTGGWAWIGVTDCAAAHDELKAKGARIRHAPTNYPWAYEMQVEDIDGNVLRIGSEPLEDQPAGEWLDMQGRIWPPAVADDARSAAPAGTGPGAATNDALNQDALFREAVSHVDAGDVVALERLLAAHPRLACERLDSPGEWLRAKVGGALDGFFRRPYLLWFVAEDPVRNGRLPKNIAQTAGALIRSAQRACPEKLGEQVDYALRLVAWSWIARECGVQLELLDVLLAGGASPDGVSNDALVNGNVAAAAHLIERGAALTLPTALCLERWEALAHLAPSANAAQKQFALVLAALNGKAEAIRRLIPFGVEVNAPSADLYPHGTPLHHAVCSGSLETVRVLVEAGADLNATDTAWHGTPLGWAEHYVGEKKREEDAKPYSEIAAYLRQRRARPDQ